MSGHGGMCFACPRSTLVGYRKAATLRRRLALWCRTSFGPAQGEDGPNVGRLAAGRGDLMSNSSWGPLFVRVVRTGPPTSERQKLRASHTRERTAGFAR